ncbi:metalloregulator ArsR/SmtB family transcription factor [Marinicella sp. S1101]|uniref:ArsR/SmtB family transcription factor n=1 Tax=Marinicella marina TaxID=2996016 RepID=UPI002260BBA9|nr:metalloregulator ArsR/SmtB family transcription factor [Marinicella marina]MCX7553384.1 metalloregulator ArsR/SmtB family transcription factor [Marinicella marina]MDJ1139116.1 metalloregulator ArsR/SmtB family transcription factor [Marinicella marina]
MINPTDFFKTLSDATRLRCLFLLSRCESLCVCDFMEILTAPQSRISRHFKYLRDAGLVVDERRDQWVHYRINPDLGPELQQMLAANMSHLDEQQPFVEDLQRLKVYQEKGCC